MSIDTKMRLEGLISQCYVHHPSDNSDLVECAKRLLDHAATVANAVDEEGRTLFCHACMGSSEKMVRLLLDYGAEPNLPRKNGCLPIHLTIINHRPYIDILHGHGADLDVYDDKGRTPLCIACEQGEWNVITKLLELGANPNKSAKSGSFPLHIVVKAHITEVCYPDGVEYLFQMLRNIFLSDDVRVVHPEDDTLKCVNVLLLHKGIDIYVRDENDKTSYQYVWESSDENLIDCFRGKGCLR